MCFTVGRVGIQTNCFFETIETHSNQKKNQQVAVEREASPAQEAKLVLGLELSPVLV